MIGNNDVIFTYHKVGPSVAFIFKSRLTGRYVISIDKRIEDEELKSLLIKHEMGHFDLSHHAIDGLIEVIRPQYLKTLNLHYHLNLYQDKELHSKFFTKEETDLVTSLLSKHMGKEVGIQIYPNNETPSEIINKGNKTWDHMDYYFKNTPKDSKPLPRVGSNIFDILGNEVDLSKHGYSPVSEIEPSEDLEKIYDKLKKSKWYSTAGSGVGSFNPLTGKRDIVHTFEESRKIIQRFLFDTIGADIKQGKYRSYNLGKTEVLKKTPLESLKKKTTRLRAYLDCSGSMSYNNEIVSDFLLDLTEYLEVVVYPYRGEVRSGVNLKGLSRKDRRTWRNFQAYGGNYLRNAISHFSKTRTSEDKYLVILSDFIDAETKNIDARCKALGFSMSKVLLIISPTFRTENYADKFEKYLRDSEATKIYLENRE